jgi:hypothetical protein
VAASDDIQPRYAKGANLSQLVPLLRKRRKVRPFGPLSPGAERLLEERILDHVWYPHAPFVELLRVMYREVLGNNEANAMSAGIAGGKVALQGAHKAFVIANDPIASVMAMRHSWRAYFNFGDLKAARDSDRQVTLTLTGYPDVIAVHGGLIAGWAIAAAQLGGAPTASGEILEKPWVSGTRMVYRVQI